VKQRISSASAVLVILCLACLPHLGCAGVSSAHSAVTGSSLYSLSGTISPAASGIGVTLQLKGAADLTATTDASGNYTFVGLGSGSYTVTPSKTSFSFSPSSQSVTVNSASVTGVNFTASIAAGSGLSIAGTILPSVSGATVSLSGATSATAVTDSNGNYSFVNLVSGNYTITPSEPGFSFSPASQSVTLGASNVIGVNFTGSSGSGSGLSLSGIILPGISGATVSLSGTESATAISDSNGNYSFANLVSGNYTITPSQPGFSFSPASQSATLGATSIIALNFTRTSTSTLSISGTMIPANIGSGVTVTLSGAAGATTTTDTNGNYSFTALPIGDYTLTPTKAGFNFSPSSQSTILSTANLAGINFIVSSGSGSGMSISGNISPAKTGAGVIVALSGAVTATTITDGSGNYSFANLSAGNYVLTPTEAGFALTPSSQSVSLGTTSVTGVNFTSSAIPGLSISGNMTPVANGIGVTVTLSGTASATTTTDSSGFYGFYGLAAGTYTLAPSKTGFAFSPSSRQLTTAGADIGSTNFVAFPASQLSPPIVISGQNGTVIENLTITSTSGDCVTIINSTNITIQNSEIGPCAGNGIRISGGGGINIFDSYIHPETQSLQCCDNNDGIFAKNVQTLLVQGNVIAYSESNIEVQGSSDVTATGNLLLNPRGAVGTTVRGDNFQCAGYNNAGTIVACSNVTVENNYTLSSTDTTAYLYPEDVQDSINFYNTNTILAQGNYITGGHSSSGCALNADTGANSADFEQNIVVDTGQCGVAIHDGTNQIMNANKVIITNPVPGAGNTAMVVDQGKNTLPCGPVQVSNNIAALIQTNGTATGFHQGPGCTPVTLTNNTFGAAAVTSLTPSSTVLLPPLIPPQPKNCVVLSPYSTQTSSPSCTR